MDSALARGVSWGFGEDAVEEPEDPDPASKVPAVPLTRDIRRWHSWEASNVCTSMRVSHRRT